MIRIAIDGLGGDFVPKSIAQSIVDFLKVEDQAVVKVATTPRHFKAVEGLLDPDLRDRCCLLDSQGSVSFEDAPVRAIKAQPNCSVVVAMDCLRRGGADAVLSFGHTGATVVAAQLRNGLLEGLDRPALAAILPRKSGYGLLLDVGASLKPKPMTLLQYGLMGEEYVRKALGLESPRVGLLNVGEERGKGDECRQEAFALMSKSDMGFVGNVEGGQLFDGTVDVVVCSGFEGNVVLKACEGLATMLFAVISEGVSGDGARVQSDFFDELHHRHRPSSRGASRLLGVKGTVLVGHGNAKGEAIKNGLFQAFREAKLGLQPALLDRLRSYSCL
jgi:glycerol-3-phosphate acyltransferase PlsX